MKIRHLIFDLDNTLYPCTAAMDEGITRRMLQCVADFFSVTFAEAVQLRAKNIAHFSTTLEWLRHEGLTDVEGFFAAVHPEDEADELPYEPKLRAFLQSIPLPKSVFTNAPREHAERVLAKLNVRDLFENVIDIRDSALKGKPYPEAFYHALERCGGTITDTLFFDDMQKYTDGFEAIGGTAALVGNKNGKPLHKTAAAVLQQSPVPGGRTLRINSIYDAPALLHSLQGL